MSNNIKSIALNDIVDAFYNILYNRVSLQMYSTNTAEYHCDGDGKTHRVFKFTKNIFLSSSSGVNSAVSHYSDLIMGAMVSQITSLAMVYPTVYSGADQRNHQSSASLVFVRGIHR